MSKGKSSFKWNDQWGKSATQRHVGTGVPGQQCRQSSGYACGWAAGTVALGAREGHRGWVMQNFVCSAKKLGFCSGGEGSILRELDLHFVQRFLKILFLKNHLDNTIEVETGGREVNHGLFEKK